MTTAHEGSRLIAAVKTPSALRQALDSPVDTIFLLDSTILRLPVHLKAVRAAAKHGFVHMDLAEGIGKDAAGLAYLASLGATGIVSTKSGLIRTAKTLGLQTVQRFFIIDTQSESTASSAIRLAAPDYVEIMPGVVPKVIRYFAEHFQIPVIAGGLIQTAAEVREALDAGAEFVSVSQPAIWMDEFT